MEKFIDSCKIQTKCLPIKFRQQFEILPAGIYTVWLAEIGDLLRHVSGNIKYISSSEIYNKTRSLFLSPSQIAVFPFIFCPNLICSLPLQRFGASYSDDQTLNLSCFYPYYCQAQVQVHIS